MEFPSYPIDGADQVEALIAEVMKTAFYPGVRISVNEVMI